MWCIFIIYFIKQKNWGPQRHFYYYCLIDDSLTEPAVLSFWVDNSDGSERRALQRARWQPGAGSLFISFVEGRGREEDRGEPLFPPRGLPCLPQSPFLLACDFLLICFCSCAGDCRRVCFLYFYFGSSVCCLFTPFFFSSSFPFFSYCLLLIFISFQFPR